LEAERNLWDEENHRLASELEQAEIAPNIEHRVPEIITLAGSLLENPTIGNMRELLELFNPKVTFYNRGKILNSG